MAKKHRTSFMDVPSSLFPSSIPLPPNTVLQQWPRCIGRKKARQTARPSQEKPPRCRTEPPRRAVCAVLSCALPSERQQKQALKKPIYVSLLLLL